MKRKVLTMGVAVLSLLLTLTACGSSEETGNSISSVTNNIASGIENVTNSVTDSIGQLINGNVTGEVGKTYSTQWFSFTIKSIETVSEYAGHTAPDGMKLIDVVVEETNIFDSPIPMGTFDYYVDEASLIDYIYPISPLDETMMPDEFELAVDETVEFHMIFEVPADINNYQLLYTEVDEYSEEGATFTINFTAE